MSKIKIIKIEVGEAPSGFYAQYLDRIVSKPIRVSFTEGEAINPDLEETYTRERLPIQRYAHGKHWEEYYIRDEDKNKFEDLVNAYVNNSKIELLREIRDFLYSENKENILDFVKALLNREKLKEEIRMKQATES